MFKTTQEAVKAIKRMNLHKSKTTTTNLEIWNAVSAAII